jgi:3-oxoacyl-[acyl-carrier protein] reductase
MRSLDGAGVLVSGGSRGIGLAAAHRFPEESSRVFLPGRHAAEVDAAVAELRGLGSADGTRWEVSDETLVDRLVERAVGS